MKSIERIEALEDRFNELSAKMIKMVEDSEKNHRVEINKIRKTIVEMQAGMDLIDKVKARKLMNKLSKRIRDLSERLEVEILKDTVLSEVARIYPETWRLLVKSLDKPDSWWRDGSDLSIEGWRNYLEITERVNGEMQ